MPLLGHWPELFFVLLIGLLVFGPKRMIEMGTALGKAVREMRDSLKDIPGVGSSGLQSLMGQEESQPQPRRTPFLATSQMAPTSIGAPTPAVAAAPTIEPAAVGTEPALLPPANQTVVEGTVERVEDMPED